MKILHILRSEPDEMTRNLIQQSFKDAQNTEVLLFKENVNYEELVTDIFSCNKVISWW